MTPQRQAFLTWFFLVAGLVWFWSTLLRAAEHYERWKWIVQ